LTISREQLPLGNRGCEGKLGPLACTESERRHGLDHQAGWIWPGEGFLRIPPISC
jgi:hypothetical protein